MRYAAVVVAIGLLGVAACGGGGGGSGQALPPNVNAKASTSSGVAPLTVQFDASGSTDPQNQSLNYSWAFGDGSAASSGAIVSHTFNDHGTYSVTVTVSDGTSSASKSFSIQASPAPPSVQALSILVNVLGVAPTNASAQLSASDRENLPLTYSISTPATVGQATINSTNGAITYTVPGFVTASTTSFVVSVANPGTSTQESVNVALNSDPLLANQWHLQNTGQDAFASVLPTPGDDLDVAGAWASGFSGKGIKVAIVDTGLEIAHEDLAANVDPGHSFNFATGSNDPSPTSQGFDHGTAVAGIVAAVAFNGKGGRGVAYNATLRGYNLIGNFTLANMAFAFGGSAISSDNDLFNASFGPVTNAIPSFSGAYQAITQTTLNMRGGLGAPIVNAAGNDFRDFEAASSPLCQTAQQYGVSCGDPASDERRGGYAPIIVGAVDADGTHASYSNTGSSLWISAPGGEYGVNSSYTSLSAFPDPTDAVKPAIITTNRTGCANAEYSFAVNALDDLGGNPLAAQCQYTAVMNGTSSATPNVSGVIAMMLEANPKLSVRDIKYILAKTAKRVDPNFAGVSSSNVIAGSRVVLEQGWVRNDTGFYFSNRYGFGEVDAAAALAAAKAYTSYLPPLVNSTGNYQFTAAPPAVIPPASTTGGYINFAVSEPFPAVEFVVVFVNIASTPGLPCNQIELTSPSGTKSILLHAANGFTNTGLANSRFESNAFYGEPVNGTWTLRFLDFCAASGTPTTLSTSAPQTLLFAGH
ncbi:MAG: S8 family serine peptidase [Steroidobacteraceae bacterium]